MKFLVPHTKDSLNRPICLLAALLRNIIILATVIAPIKTNAQENSLIAPGAMVDRIASGFGFVEGPAADADGALYFTDIPNNRIYRWTIDNGVQTFMDESEGANGLRVDLAGNLLVCQMGARRVIAINREGDNTVLADHFEGARLNSPNDLWVDPKGGIYFTDPRYGPTDDEELSGYYVYYISPNRSEVQLVVDDLIRPNGIVGTLDGARVYVADHGAGRTYAYTPQDDGSLTDKQLFVRQGADGMTMDDLGNVYLTGQDITVYNPDGEPIQSIAVPEPPANLTFGGPDGTTLFITARTSLYALEMMVGGQ